MKYDPNRNAKVIIPLALAVWLGGILAFMSGAPAVVEIVYVVAFAVAVPVVVFYLIGEAGWRALARHFRATAPFKGTWQPCPTGQMALVSVDHPEFHKARMRFVGGSLRVATTDDALLLSTMVSGIPILGWFLPSLRIPWTAVSRGHAFEAPGWVTPARESGALLQVSFDPNYTGTFIELEAGDPLVFIQLPAGILGQGVSRLPGMAMPPAGS